MLDQKKVLAIIPARGGSKRLPRKNVLPLAGKPLITWTIDAAINSFYVDEVVVSTDCKLIASCAKKAGAKIPFLRPSDLAKDNSSSVDVVIHSIEYYKEKSIEFDYVILLQPTSPLRTFEHIDEAISLLEKKEADAVVSVCKAEHPPQWTNYIPEDGRMDEFIASSMKNKRSQDFSRYCRLNGAIYIVKTERLLSEKTLFINDNIFAYEMPVESSIDIDEQLDFDIAELILSKRV